MSEVRISGGALRGRKLTVPKPARPTEGRVREALFSIWAGSVEGARFLDLFAGSGAVGFEAYSRGARAVVLVDASKEVARELARSRERLAIPASAAAIVTAQLPAARLPVDTIFDLIFADPPYAFERHRELLEMAAPLLGPGGELVLEHATRDPAPLAGGGLILDRERLYGGSALAFYRAANPT